MLCEFFLFRTYRAVLLSFTMWNHISSMLRWYLFRTFFSFFLPIPAPASHFEAWNALALCTCIMYGGRRSYHRGGGNPLPSSYRNKALILITATALYTAWLYHSGMLWYFLSLEHTTFCMHMIIPSTDCLFHIMISRSSLMRPTTHAFSRVGGAGQFLGSSRRVFPDPKLSAAAMKGLVSFDGHYPSRNISLTQSGYFTINSKQWPQPAANFRWRHGTLLPSITTLSNIGSLTMKSQRTKKLWRRSKTFWRALERKMCQSRLFSPKPCLVSWRSGWMELVGIMLGRIGTEISKIGRLFRDLWRWGDWH